MATDVFCIVSTVVAVLLCHMDQQRFELRATRMQSEHSAIELPARVHHQYCPHPLKLFGW